MGLAYPQFTSNKIQEVKGLGEVIKHFRTIALHITILHPRVRVMRELVTKPILYTIIQGVPEDVIK